MTGLTLVVPALSVPAVAASAGSTTGWATSEWRVVDLGALGGERNSNVYAVNDRGMAVGDSSVDGGGTHAFLWRDGKMIDLGTLGGSISTASDVNNRGDVVGHSQLANGDVHAFLWRAGRMTDLGTVVGTVSSAQAINERGVVVGYGYDGTSETYDGYAFLWRRGRMTRLPGLEEGVEAGAVDINERGQVVGSNLLTSSWQQFPVLWQAGTVRPIVGLPGTPEAINDRGDVISSDGYLWSRGRLTEIAGSGETTHPLGINNRRDIVGATSTSAFFWAQGRLTRLPSPFGYGGEVAQDVDASGTLVVGNAVEGIGDGGRYHAVMWIREKG